ncbi:MAG: NADH:flavin oxidoreductase [Sphingobium sp.]
MTIRLGDPVQFDHGPPMPNRMMLAPLTNQQSHADGTISGDEHDFYVSRAQGGFGLVMTCAAHVQREGQGFPGQLGIWSDAHVPDLSALADAIRAAGSLSSIQLQHAGKRARPALTGVQAFAPVADAAADVRAMETAEVERLIEDFIQAAVRVEQAGFDGAALHGAHGYMLCSFLDVENQRTDRFGGSFDNRCRPLFEIMEGIRARTGPDFQLGLRISPERYGVLLAEARVLAERAMACGLLDYLDISFWDVTKTPVEPEWQDHEIIDLFMDIPRGRTKLGVAGRIGSAARAQMCLDRGADFLLIGRGAILHADFARAVLADDGFCEVERPVTEDYLAGQGLSRTFAEYMRTFKGFVVGGAT